MCIVIDANTLAHVFNCRSAAHTEFAPVLEWIAFKRGKMVFGGSKYSIELQNAGRYIPIITELERAGRVVLVPGSLVDEIQAELERGVDDRDFNDAHIVAIIIASGCKLICSCDKRAYKFYKNNSLYPKYVDVPKIYTGARGRELLNEKYIANCCKPCPTASRHLRHLFGG